MRDLWVNCLAVAAAMVLMLPTAGCAPAAVAPSVASAVNSVPAPPKQATTPFDEYDDAGTVLVSISPKLGDSELVDVQLAIIDKAIAFGPVMVFVADAESRHRVVEEGAKRQWNDALHSGNLRVVDMEFEGPWIRDYGPQFSYVADGGLAVVDARYHDVRADWQIEVQQAEVDRGRLEIVVERSSANKAIEFRRLLSGHRDDDDNDIAQLMLNEYHALRSRTGGSWAAKQLEKKEAEDRARREADRKRADDEERLNEQDARARAAERLELLRVTKEILDNRTFTGRLKDDRAPFPVAKSVLSGGTFKLWYPDVDIDGGNLIRLKDGRCLTTSDLKGRNVRLAAGGASLTDLLKQFYGCVDTIFLRALPGDNVIEHVDMFVLPTGGNTILLADYRPRRELFLNYLAGLSDDLRGTIVQAAVAMDENALVLKSYGYTVTRVPSPLPTMRDGNLVYPTVLNALVRAIKGGRKQVILPHYKGYEEDVQARARGIIANAFGDAAITDVEAMHAAQEQGAVHCLTLVAPWSQSVFADGWAEISEEMTTVVPANDYRGVWRVDGKQYRFHISNRQIQLVRDDDTVVRTWATVMKEKIGSRYVFIVEGDTTDISLDITDDHGVIEVTPKDSKPARYVLKRRLAGERTKDPEAPTIRQ
jgi:agmatine/peptidylarginine deiminase